MDSETVIVPKATVYRGLRNGKQVAYNIGICRRNTGYSASYYDNVKFHHLLL